MMKELKLIRESADIFEVLHNNHTASRKNLNRYVSIEEKERKNYENNEKLLKAALDKWRGNHGK